MLWKQKGSSNDPSKYRCICLLNHTYEVLATITLQRLLTGTSGFLKDWQAGFRAGRGCRDNTMILRTICQKMMHLGKTIAVTFVDYSAAFDTVSHKCVDEALGIAGVSAKVRSMFRAVYKSASASTAYCIAAHIFSYIAVASSVSASKSNSSSFTSIACSNCCSFSFGIGRPPSSLDSRYRQSKSLLGVLAIWRIRQRQVHSTSAWSFRSP